MPDNIVEKIRLRRGGPLYDIRDNTKLPVSGGTVTGDLGIEGDLSLDSPLAIQYGGTGATTAVTAAQNLRVLTLGEAYSYIPESGNLNGYTTPGVYSINTDAIAASLYNAPSTLAGVLRVWNAVGNNKIVGHVGDSYFYLCQEYVDRNARVWRRLGDSGSTSTITWWGWEQVLTTGRYTSNLNTLYDGLISAGNPSDPGAVALHFVNNSAQNAPHPGNGMVLTQKVGAGNWGSQFFVNDTGAFYRAKKNGTWDSWINAGVGFPKFRSLSGEVAAVHESWSTIFSTSLPAGYAYLLVAMVDSTIDSTGTIIAQFTGVDTPWSSRAFRGTMASGGGLTCWGYLGVKSTATTVTLRGYGSYNGTYNYRGVGFALQLPHGSTF